MNFEDALDNAIKKLGYSVRKWISVEEKLPDNDGYYLCTYIFDNQRFYYDRWFNEKSQKFMSLDNITHWMELPEPPI